MNYLIERAVTCVTVLDISGAALTRARARLGAEQDVVTWIEADVTAAWPVPSVDIWHDRAVFHFLTQADDRARYLGHVRHGLRTGGSLVMATFGPDGPEKCSGLPVMHYSPDALAAELGGQFRLRDAVPEMHATPFGTTQAFWYTRFTLENPTIPT